jgi:hypothetical protein
MIVCPNTPALIHEPPFPTLDLASPRSNAKSGGVCLLTTWGHLSIAFPESSKGWGRREEPVRHCRDDYEGGGALQGVKGVPWGVGQKMWVLG